MSLSLALSSAMSGLALSSRGTQVVSDNIANAHTEGYAVRTLNQTSRVLGQTGSGVMITGVSRQVNHALLAELRGAASHTAHDAVLGGFWQRFETEFGLPGEAGSLSQNLSRLGAALQQASQNPDQNSSLQQVTQSASAIARSIAGLQDRLQLERDDADAAILREITTVNQSLENIAELNRKIQSQTLLGGSPAALIDARQHLVDEISARIPVREFMRDDGRIMLMAQDGSILVDREAAQFDFARSVQPGPADRVENGALSAISLNGHELRPGNAMFETGQIGALLQIRDIDGPLAQQQLDLVAFDLVNRFADQTVDPSLAPNQFGLFSLEGLAGLPGEVTGIAGQLRVNPLLDPAQGGETWRLRAGMNAPAPGDVLDNAILNRMAQALDAPRALAGTSGAKRSASLHASNLLSDVARSRLDVEQQGTFNAARYASLREAFSAEGVDTDAELSKLLRLEQAYSANARVLSTVDAMMRTILEI